MNVKEEPILAGVPGGRVPWRNKEQPLGGGGNWNEHPAPAPNGTVFSITNDWFHNTGYPGSLYVAGSFDSIGAEAVGRIASFTQSSWKPLGAGIGDGVVYCVASNDSLVFAGGTFSEGGGVAVHRIAEWDGTNWHPLGIGVPDGVDSTVLALAIMGDSLFVGGNFTHAGGQLVNHIVIWNIATSEWEPIMDSGIAGVDGGVAAILAPSGQDSMVFIGGGFLHAGKKSASKIAEWNSGQWSGIGSGVNETDGVVESLCENGSFGRGLFYGLIAGGHFSHIGDSAATDVALWNISYPYWTPFRNSNGDDAFQGIDGTVYSVAYGAHLYAAGDFSRGPSDSSKYLVDVNGFDLAPGLDGPAYAVLPLMLPTFGDYVEGFLVGGAFLHAGGQVAPYFTNWQIVLGVTYGGSDPNQIFAFPNPTSDRSTIQIQLQDPGFVELTVYNSIGEKVGTLCRSMLDRGIHTFDFNTPRNSASGNALFLVMNSSGKITTSKLILQ